MFTTGPNGYATPRSQRSLMIWTLIGIFSFTAIGFSHWLTRPPVDLSEEIDFVNRFSGGTLVIAGGGPLPLEIRQKFLALAGGPERAQLVVIPSFDADERQATKLRKAWQDLGVHSVEILHTRSRLESDQAEFVRPLERATGIWLSGGSQDWLSKHYAGTLVEEKLKAHLNKGGVVGGSSAGAAAMSKVMIEQGAEEAVEGVGFDLFCDAVIDQHFLRRSRLNRLMGLMESHPERIAFGIDEGTALVVQIPHGRLGVIGSSYALAYIPKTERGERRFESLKHGDQIDLAGLKSGRVRVSSSRDLDAALAAE